MSDLFDAAADAKALACGIPRSQALAEVLFPEPLVLAYGFWEPDSTLVPRDNP
jgi:hypothetical protein